MMAAQRKRERMLANVIKPAAVTFESPVTKMVAGQRKRERMLANVIKPPVVTFESPVTKMVAGQRKRERMLANVIKPPVVTFEPSPLTGTMDALAKQQTFVAKMLRPKPAISFETPLAKSMETLLRPKAFQRAFVMDPALFRAAASVAQDLVADGLDLTADVDAGDFTWSLPSVDDLKTAQHLFWLSMVIACAITLTVTDRVPDTEAILWLGAAERTLAFAIFMLELYKR